MLLPLISALTIPLALPSPPAPLLPAPPSAEVVRPYAPPDRAWGAGHRGMDLAAPAGAPVCALAGGPVLFVGRVGGKGVVTVGLAGGRRVTYEPVEPVVAVGDLVLRGQVLGLVASAGGHCGGDAGCLHVGLRRAARYLDPSVLLVRAPAVLKPR